MLCFLFTGPKNLLEERKAFTADDRFAINSACWNNIVIGYTDHDVKSLNKITARSGKTVYSVVCARLNFLDSLNPNYCRVVVAI